MCNSGTTKGNPSSSPSKAQGSKKAEEVREHVRGYDRQDPDLMFQNIYWPYDMYKSPSWEQGQADVSTKAVYEGPRIVATPII